MVDRARLAAIEYLNSKESREYLKVSLIRLKQEFFKDPTSPNTIREKQLANLKNIAFLYIDAKLMERGELLEDVIPNFDTDKKGYEKYFF